MFNSRYWSARYWSSHMWGNTEDVVDPPIPPDPPDPPDPPIPPDPPDPPPVVEPIVLGWTGALADANFGELMLGGMGLITEEEEEGGGGGGGGTGDGDQGAGNCLPFGPAPAKPFAGRL